jgi:hypothetical protein
MDYLKAVLIIRAAFISFCYDFPYLGQAKTKQGIFKQSNLSLFWLVQIKFILS